ncbi:unnamed protein product [Closterium sp. NIES-53]
MLLPFTRTVQSPVVQSIRGLIFRAFVLTVPRPIACEAAPFERCSSGIRGDGVYRGVPVRPTSSISPAAAVAVGPRSRSVEEIDFFRSGENLVKFGDAAEQEFLRDVAFQAAGIAVDAFRFVHISHLLVQRHKPAGGILDGTEPAPSAELLSHSDRCRDWLESCAQTCSALKDVESNLRSVAAASGTVSPPLFHGCTVPQLPTFTASLATAATDATAAAVTTASRSRGRGGKKGGSGGGGGGGSGGSGGAVATGGGGSAASGETPRAAADDSTAPAGGGDPRARQSPPVLPAPLGGAATWYQAQRQQHLQQQQQPLSSQQPQQQQRQQLAPGSGLRQPQRGAAYPPCPYQVQTGPRRGHPCGRFHPPGQCFAQLTDTVRLTYGVSGPAPDWLPLVQRYGSALWGMSAEQLVDLISAPHAMYAVVDSSVSDSVYSSVVSLGASLAQLPVASVGTCVDSRPATTSGDASLSFTLDSGASHCFFRDSTTLTPLPAPVSIALADPTTGPVTARHTTTLPCPAAPSGSLTGFHVPSFSRNLVGVRPLVSQHVGVWFEPSGETAVCVDGDSYQPLATFTAEPGSGLYTLHTGPRAPQQQQQQQQQQHQRPHQQPPLLPLPPVPPPVRVPVSHQVASSPQVSVSCQVPTSVPVAASCSCRSLAHPTVLWHHRMGHPSLPRLRAMSSQRLVLGLPRVLPSLPPSLAPPCRPCVEGRLRATPHSSSLRPATEPFETLHLDVWGPAPRLGPERERYFLVVVDDFSRYTTMFPLAKKSEVTSTLIRWLLTTEDTRGRRVSCLHSDRGGEFRSGILAGFCHEQGIRQSWTLPESPQQNGVAERRIGLVMEITRTSLTHACAPHFLWPYAVRYAAHQLNLWPETIAGADCLRDEHCLRSLLRPRFEWGCQPHLCRLCCWHQARVRRARDEQLELEREERELQRLAEQQQQLDPQEQQSQQQQSQQQPLPPPVSGLRALGLPSPSPPSSASPPVYGPTFPPPDSSLAVFPSSPPLSSSPPSRSWATRRSPRARPSSPVPFTDLRTAFLRSSPPRPSQSVLPSPPESALTVSLPTPVTDYYRMYRPVLSRVLASLVTHPRVSVSSVSALTAAVTDFASTRRLDYATTLVTAPPTSPLVVGGVSALGCDALEDRQFELEFLAAAFPHLCAMLLAPEGDPNAFDIPTPRTYAEAVSGPWASQWRAAMDAEMASYRSTGTYVDEVPPPGANVVDGMWIYRVKRPPGSPPVFKARYVARGFSQREGVNFFQTFAPTPKMTTLRVLLHVAAQRDYELHSLDFSTAFLQGSLHEELCFLLDWSSSLPARSCSAIPAVGRFGRVTVAEQGAEDRDAAAYKRLMALMKEEARPIGYLHGRGGETRERLRISVSSFEYL